MTPEQQAKLKELLDAGILTQKEYDAKTNPEESWSLFKFISGMFHVVDSVKWSKDIASIFNIRKLIIYALVLGSIYGYGYIKGIRNKPVHFDMRGKEATIKLNEHYLHILPDGSAQVVDKDGKVLKTIKVSDIPELERKLRPIGLDIRPFVTMGGSVGTGEKTMAGEVGIGTQVFKIYKVHLDAFLTNIGAYVGADYQLTENFSALAGIGKGYSGDDTRVFLGGLWKF